MCVSLRLHGGPSWEALEVPYRCSPPVPVQARPLLGGTISAIPVLSSLPHPWPAAVARPLLGSTRGAIPELSSLPAPVTSSGSKAPSGTHSPAPTLLMPSWHWLTYLSC